MKSFIKNIFAVILGIMVGSIVNMSLIFVSSYIIPPPGGIDNTALEGLSESMQLFEPKHFLFPFLAHALGTFAGALVATLLASGHQLKFALTIGFVFLFGGAANVMLLPSPLWFNLVDIIFAYIPMALLAWKITERKQC